MSRYDDIYADRAWSWDSYPTGSGESHWITASNGEVVALAIQEEELAQDIANLPRYKRLADMIDLYLGVSGWDVFNYRLVDDIKRQLEALWDKEISYPAVSGGQETTVLSDSTIQRRAVGLVLEERDRQDLKWGDQRHDPYTWLAILTEEIGEVSQAILHDTYGGRAAGTLQEELVQATAVALQWLEKLLDPAPPPEPETTIAEITINGRPLDLDTRVIMVMRGDTLDLAIDPAVLASLAALTIRAERGDHDQS